MCRRFDKFRQGRVGTYSGKGRHDSDQEMEDDYTQLAAYTRRMNINWSKERCVARLLSFVEVLDGIV